MKTLAALDSADSTLHRVLFWTLLILAIALRIAAFQGYSDSDPRSYSILANDLAHGIFHAPDYVGAPVFPLRIAIYAPPAALIRWFGLSETTLVAYPFVISVAASVLTYWFTRMLFGSLAALLALLIVAMLPLDIQMASALYPDAIAAFWANFGLYCIWHAARSTSSARVAALGATGGLLFGVSWLCKEAVVYLAPFVLLLAWFGNRQQPTKSRLLLLAAIGAASGAVLAGEMLFYWHATGDALFRLHATERNYLVTSVWFFDTASPYFGWREGGYWHVLLRRLFMSGPKDILLNGSFAKLPFIALIGIAWSVFHREGRGWLAAAWLLVLLLMFNFMTSSFDAYKPLVILDRYIYPLLLPACILTSAFLVRLFHSGADQPAARERAFWGTALLAGLALFVVKGAPALKTRTEAIERQTAAVLDKSSVVYSDFRTAANLVFFRDGTLTSEADNSKPWEGVAESSIPEGAYVLVHSEKIGFLQRSYRYRPPDYVEHPPSDWRKVADINGAALYRVARVTARR